MHHLQKYILDRLRFEQPLSYSQMLPKGTESSQFMYHLKLLMKGGLVQKESRGVYTLTHAGKATLEYLSVNRITPVRMPRVITYTLLTHQGKLLLLRKQKEPYRHLVEPVAGKIHFGEDANAAAQREVWEKLGLRIPKPQFVGIADMLISEHGEPLTHMTVYAHKLELTTMPAELPEQAVAGTLDSLPHDQFVPGTVELITAIQATNPPFVITIRASHDHTS
jgi:8-oxo-dGTP pyrophosphatase MutT (NUDIX family)